MNRRLVSVIIIFLNEEKFIQEAIESVIAQRYDNWELLLVDDGSTDGSTEIARRYAGQHPVKVRYLEHESHKNCGMSASRNLGIRHAAGDYLAFLDADDIWFPYTLEQQVAILSQQPAAAMVYGPIEWWYSWTGDPADAQRDYVEELGVPPEQMIDPPTLLPLFLENKATVPSGMLIRRETVARVGGFEDVFRGEYEDQVFCAKVCVNLPIFASGHCWYRYRQHPDSCVAIGHKAGRTRAARLFFLQWLASYLRQQKLNNPVVWQALRRQQWRWRHPLLAHWVRRGQHLLRAMIERVRTGSPTYVETRT